jgi:hypothetical protein
MFENLLLTFAYCLKAARLQKQYGAMNARGGHTTHGQTQNPEYAQLGTEWPSHSLSPYL